MNIHRLLAHDHWANGGTLASLERSRAPSEKALQLMSHVLSAEAGWLKRMGAKARFDGFWPGADLAGLRKAWAEELPPSWKSLLADAALSDPRRTITYVNSKGETWRSTVEDVCVHVFLHSSYHRGQVASEVRGGGDEPATTDFIHATRTGVVP
jgi:uncharacterized damage-inducible protein DinB